MSGFPYWVLYMSCWRLSVRAKNCSKSNLLKVDLCCWWCWEVDLVLEIGWFDPKWYPKLPLLISYTCRRFWVNKNHFCSFLHKIRGGAFITGRHLFYMSGYSTQTAQAQVFHFKIISTRRTIPIHFPRHSLEPRQCFKKLQRGHRWRKKLSKGRTSRKVT